MQDERALVLPLDRVRLADLPQVGGKNASLGELIGTLAPRGVRVPGGFALTVRAMRRHLEHAELADWIAASLAALDVHDVTALAAVAGAIRRKIAAAELPPDVAAAARAAYADSCARAGRSDLDVAVRSSATAEDLPEASFAGQHETYLNVHGWPALDTAIRACIASLYTDRAIVYRTERGIPHAAVGLSVGVQRMVRSDLGAAGVMFTLDTETGCRDVCLIDGAYGLGELVVQGRVDPDEFWVHKPSLARGFRPLVRKDLGAKAQKLVYGAAGGARAVREVRVPHADRERFVLSDDEVLELARWGVLIEEVYSERAGHALPMDIEWAKDGQSGEMFVVQARPETVHARARPRIEVFTMRGTGPVLARGKSVGSRVGAGRVQQVRSAADLAGFQDGAVLVAAMTDPDWQPVLERCAAVVTDHGGRTCHAAIVSRELGIPCVVGTGDATRALADGAEVTVSCAEGDVGRVYAGRVPFACEQIDPAELPQPKVPLLLNLANPALAFRVAQLPAAGVGLLRIEFLVGDHIGVHPMALVHPERVADAKEREEILRRAAPFGGPQEFFVGRLAEGVAQIAAAFWPRDVLVRFSDFKSNEYAALLGGRAFEPVEANPMIGFRGASRYYDERYREGFALECRALRRVRDEMGLVNTKLMIPFCRTLEEGRRVLAELEANGLRRGDRGLEVWVMCEIPNNVILAEEFAELFDGFSIGSNDLTQLTLGVDRDSQLLAHLFDERDPGVKRMIELVVARAHGKGVKVGLCGQAPSDHPDFAAFLVDVGIDSISLNPDSIAAVARRIAR